MTLKKQKLLFYTPMALYIAFIVVFLVTRFSVVYLLTQNSAFYNIYPHRNVNFVPFQTLRFYTTGDKNQYLDVYANILLFVPMGVYIHTLSCRKRVWASLLAALAVGVAIEGMQFALATGSLDVDDILMNLLGSALGIGIYTALHTACRKDDALARGIMGIASFAVIPLLFLTVVQDAYWFPPCNFAAVSLLVLAAFYAGMLLLIQKADKIYRRALLASAVLLSALYFGVVLPEVGP